MDNEELQWMLEEAQDENYDLKKRLEQAERNLAIVRESQKNLAKQLVSTRSEQGKAEWRAREAEQAVARVREVIKGAPKVDPLRGFAGPPDDWPDDTDFISYGEWIMANRVREALDGEPNV